MTDNSVPTYRELAAEALALAQEYRHRARLIEQRGNHEIARDYHQYADEALANAQRYQLLAERVEKKS